MGIFCSNKFCGQLVLFYRHQIFNEPQPHKNIVSAVKFIFVKSNAKERKAHFTGDVLLSGDAVSDKSGKEKDED